MKTRLGILKSLIVLCGVVAASAASGQTIRTWTNSASIDIGIAANWDPNGAPSGATQDTAQWDGVVPGNLTLQYITGWGNSGYGTMGVNLVLTANQTGDVTIVAPTGGSPAAGIFGITIDSPTAAFTLGDNTTRALNLATRPGNAGTVHSFVNNSTKPATMGSSVAWVAGGGVACVMDFGGTGDWIVNHVLRDVNSGAGPITVIWEGPGTMTWSSGGIFLASDPLGPIGINGGTVILKSPGLALNFVNVAVGNNRITNNGTLKYDAAAPDTIARLISGTGTLQVNSGTLTLSGANEFTGNTILSGGTLIAGSAENFGTSGPLGVGGTISFTGGALGFSAANTYDYSPRFSTAAGQVYKIDDGGNQVTLTNALTSSGGSFTKLGSGTTTLTGANTFSGATTVGAGRLVIQGSSSSGNITLSNSTSLGVVSGAQITPASLTVGTSSGANLEFNNVNSTATPLIAAGTVSTGGAIAIKVNGGTFVVGQTYPLLSWTSGSAPDVSLGLVIGAVGTLSTNGSTIGLTVSALADTWMGGTDGNWDLATSGNWLRNGSPVVFANGDAALFDDSATGETNVTLASAVSPASTTVNSSAKIYSIASSGSSAIGGTGGLTKSGSSTLALSGGVNNYSGATTLGGGTVSVGVLANGGAASDIGAAGSSAANLVFNGGALQYTGNGAAIDRLFTVSTSGGTIDSSGLGALILNNNGPIAFSGTGARTFTLTGNEPDNNTLAGALGDNGGATSLTKSGVGTWVLTGANTYSGVTTISAGTLQVGTGGANGTLGAGNVVNNGQLDFNVSSTLTVGTISGTGSVTNDGTGTVILPGDNTYQGGTTINAGTLQIGNGGSAGKIDANDPILNNGTFIVNSTGDLTLSGAISGTGQLIKRGSGLLKLLGNSTYTGPTTIDAGARLQLWQGNTGANTTPAITNNGTLIMMRQDNAVAILAGNISGTGRLQVEISNGNGGDSTLTGTNTYTGGTYILGGGLVLGDNGITPFGGSIVGDVFMTNDYLHATFSTFVSAILTFNRAEDFTFAGNIVGDGQVTQTGSGTVILTGNNTYTNGTTITAGTLQVGAGGASGSIGTGPITDNSILVIDRSGSLTIDSVISGAGSVVNTGTGTVTLTATNTYFGSTTVSNGTLVVTGGSIGGDIFVEGGTLVPAALNTGGELIVATSLTIDSGTILAPLNRSLLVTNITVNGGLIRNGGNLQVVNAGPALVAGDKFYIFNQPVAGMAVSGAGATWQNDLATDGSITALTVPAAVNPNPPVVQVSVSANTLSLAWPTNLGWTLQTNSVGLTAANQWFPYPGSASITNVNLAINPAKTNVFFRMVYTNTP